MVFVISNRTILKDYLDEFTIFSLIISALGHDIDHPARTNMFEVNA